MIFILILLLFILKIFWLFIIFNFKHPFILKGLPNFIMVMPFLAYRFRNNQLNKFLLIYHYVLIFFIWLIFILDMLTKLIRLFQFPWKIIPSWIHYSNKRNPHSGQNTKYSMGHLRRAWSINLLFFIISFQYKNNKLSIWRPLSIINNQLSFASIRVNGWLIIRIDESKQVQLQS